MADSSRKRCRANPEDLVRETNKLSPDAFAQNFLPPTSPSLVFKGFDIVLKPAASLSYAELTACFNLIELTSAAAYKASSRGWKPDAKKREMHEDGMRYLLLQRRPDSEQKPEQNTRSSQDPDTESAQADRIEGFLSFMVTIEDDYPVIYIYEIHLLPHLRGLGIGKHLMSIPKTIGEKAKLAKVMLTVFKSNSAAESFYRSLGYLEDEYSPSPKKLRGGKVKMPSYIIMSKEL